MSDIDVPPFYLHSFVATVPGTTQPVTEFANGADIQLRWQSNGTYFTVHAARDADEVYKGDEQTCVVKGRSGTTTFVLAASVVGGGKDRADPHPGFETIYLYDTLTVTVSNPDETPHSVTAGTLAVSGGSQLRGDTRLGNANVGGSLDVTGASSLNGGATATSLTVSGSTNVQGTTTLSNTAVRGPFNASGATSLVNAIVNNLTVTGSVAMMSARQVAAGPAYQATSDGILVGYVAYPGNPKLKCSAVIAGYSEGIGWLYATGGNTVVHHDANSTTMWNNANSFALPVMRDKTFRVTVTQMGGGEIAAPTSAWWVPFGVNASLTELSEAEAAALGVPDPPPIPPPSTSTDDPGPAIAELVDVLRTMLGGRLPRHAERELVDALHALTGTQPTP